MDRETLQKRLEKLQGEMAIVRAELGRMDEEADAEALSLVPGISVADVPKAKDYLSRVAMTDECRARLTAMVRQVEETLEAERKAAEAQRFGAPELRTAKSAGAYWR